jgi:hypothetical protein
LPATHSARPVGAAVDQVADEHGGAPAGVVRPGGAAERVALDLVAEVAEQFLQLGAAAVHVADDVERPGQLPLVVPCLLVDDRRGVDRLGALQDVGPPELPPRQRPQAPPQLAALPRDHVRGQVRPLRAGRVALGGHPLGHVQHDRDRQHVVVLGDPQQRLARLGLHVGRVDDGQQPAPQPLADDVVQQVERVAGGGLVVLVVGHHRPAAVGRHHLGRREVPAREVRLAGTGDPHEHDQAHLRHPDLRRRHRRVHEASFVKTPIWVGAPTSGSSSPTGTYRTR